MARFSKAKLTGCPVIFLPNGIRFSDIPQTFWMILIVKKVIGNFSGGGNDKQEAKIPAREVYKPLAEGVKRVSSKKDELKLR